VDDSVLESSPKDESIRVHLHCVHFLGLLLLEELDSLEDVVETPCLVFGGEDGVLIQGLDCTAGNGSFVALEDVLGLVGVLGDVQVPETGVGVIGAEYSVEVLLVGDELAH
jgi:hypothetical protein